ncbi:TIGR03984 family CRISPR-associated protein [Desertifilum sp. FACHB-1129]|uniref:CRISPR-associated protein n=2 Tax=Desertifilum tharense IPPAS B-1220 TaxID=1781255 RepID=A0A1E5QRE3_9CYAN|nr:MULTISPECIES: CRISPR-associated protein Csx19 [Desertifilum]MDA0212132.1 CRISPR-associated protein Csx19 [Cyanobacteria bacterium FC1]MBD2313188.1 TIGR03984 family CRISPR-associated protein [Desertifilum sp. FACHB-1129]MBD2323549.1 TIGR03984 family CRISPR-associated protein [Desertifilum sp. FACHB-866]MBD2334090.1 TIGR03984 family CRISPR-associated protein [Desertifilum sp. FACHB-868]OEJ77167.1 CRISPR-associated protein [Desertifilum tharense IPPAS B-1220]
MPTSNSITKETKLYSYHAKEMRLNNAIADCQEQLKEAIGLLYSPQSCQLARLIDGTLHDSYNRAIHLPNHADIFEARIFNESCELRWLNRISGTGDAVLISEEKQTIKDFSAPEPISCESLKQKYLLWGAKAKNSANSNDWQRLAEARIGKLDIPLNEELKEGQRVYLKTYEYLKSIDEYGNFAVIEERLAKLEVS